MSDFNLSAYDNKVPYPIKSRYDKFYVYNDGVVVENGLEILDHDERDTRRAEWLALGYTVDQKVDWPAYNAAKDAYRLEESRLLGKFKVDLTTHFDLTGHPKADQLFDKAWERGHSHGYREVFIVYQNLVDLVK